MMAGGTIVPPPKPWEREYASYGGELGATWTPADDSCVSKPQTARGLKTTHVLLTGGAVGAVVAGAIAGVPKLTAAYATGSQPWKYLLSSAWLAGGRTKTPLQKSTAAESAAIDAALVALRALREEAMNEELWALTWLRITKPSMLCESPLRSLSAPRPLMLSQPVHSMSC